MTAITTFLALAFAAAAEQPAATPAQIDELIQRLNVSWDMTEQVRANEAYKELREVGPAVVPACLRAIEEGNGSSRMWAAALLAQTKDSRGLAPLLKLLNDEEPKVRMIVSYHIHVYLKKNPDVAPALGAMLADPEMDVRQQAMKVLGKSKPPAALPSIKKALFAPDVEARADALRMVFSYEKKRADEELPKIVHSDQDGHIRSAALWIWPTVGKGGVERVLEVVAMMNDPDPLVVATSLKQLRNFFKEPPLRGQELGQVVMAVRKSIGAVAKRKEAAVRREALPLLGHLKREAGLPDLAYALKHDPDAEVRVAAAEGLARAKRVGLKVLGPLLDSLADEAPEVRSTSLKLLGALAKKDAMPPQYRRALAMQLGNQAEAILKDGDASVRGSGYVALAELLKSKVADPLLQAVQTEPDAAARKGAAIGLYVTGRNDTPAILAFVNAIGDPDPDVSTMAAKVARKLIGKGTDDEALHATVVTKLHKFATHEQHVTRAGALPLLGALEGRDALDTLVAAVRDDPNYAVRQAALDGIARTRVRVPAVVDAAIVGLKDDYEPVRELAYKLFGYITKQALPFNHKGQPEKREEEVAEIEKWWAENRAGFAEQK